MRAEAGRSGLIFWGIAAAVIAVCLPVVVEGAPLADDFNNCLAPHEQGLGGFLAESWDRLGLVRAARFAEILLTTGVCRSVHFGIAIAATLTLYVSVGLALRALLRDLEIPPPWPDLGGALWLLQPLGTEVALWPAALHVPLGLLSGLVALRAWHGRRWALGALAAVAACLSVEQVILALPLAAWLIAPAGERRRAAAVAVAVVVVVAGTFLAVPGDDPRLQAGVAERLRGLVSDPAFYVGYPAVGLGLHSVPLAVTWALPWSALLIAAGAAGGRVLGPLLRSERLAALRWRGALGRFAALLILLNIPVLLNVPRQGSPRVFAPTWLAIAAGVAVVGGRAQLSRARLIGALGGAIAACLVLSIALSVFVRLDSARFVRWASQRIAADTDDGDVVAVCGIHRTVVEPAPRGAFAVHELIYDWAAQDALAYYTDRRATFRLGGEVLGMRCPPASSVDARFDFDALVSAWEAT